MHPRGLSRRGLLAAAVTALLAAGLNTATPDTPKPAAPPEGAAIQEAPQTPGIPKPTTEHGRMARAEGVWDASVEVSIGPPGTPPAPGS